MRSKGCILIILTLCLTAFSATGTLTGVVNDGATGNPVAGAKEMSIS